MRKLFVLLALLEPMTGCAGARNVEQPSVPRVAIPNLEQVPICPGEEIGIRDLTRLDVVMFEWREYNYMPDKVALFVFEGRYSERTLFIAEQVPGGRAFYSQMTQQPMCYFVIDRGFLHRTGRVTRPVSGLVPGDNYTVWTTALDGRSRITGGNEITSFYVDTSMRGVIITAYGSNRIVVHQRERIPSVRGNPGGLIARIRIR